MRPPASSVVAPFLLVLALLVARTAAAEESLAPGYWVEDEKGKCLDGSPPGK